MAVRVAAPAPAPPQSSGRAGVLTRGTGLRWLLLPPTTVLAALLVVPVVMLLPTAAGGHDAYRTVLGDSVFHAAAIRTVVMAVIVAACTIVLGTLYALGISAAPRGVAGVLLGALLLTLWTPTLVRTFAWMLLEIPTGALYYVLHAAGLRDKPLGIYQTTLAPYPAMVHVMLPYVVLPVYVALGRLDQTQIRAARVFGARPMLVIRKVVLPQLRPSIIAGGILVFIMSLGFYVTPLLLGSPSQLTVSGLIDTEFGNLSGQSEAAAMSVILLAAIMVIYLAADRFFRVSERWG